MEESNPQYMTAFLRVCFCVVLIFFACDPGEIDLVSPENSAAETPAITIRTVLDDSHQDLAQSLGWTAGIPNVRVRLHKTDEPYDDGYWVTGETGASGTESFFDLLPGIYEVSTTRGLPVEPPFGVNPEGKVLGGGTWLRIPQNEIREIPMAPNTQSGLVISEVAIIYPLPWETGGPTYTFGTYLELYNNSSTTVFLDGMILGFGWNRYRENPTGWTCSLSLPFRTDPEGVWANMFLEFPGSGGEHPVAPGQTVLVARSAIDHTSVHYSLEDLSEADFEFGPDGSADNPDVPNLESIGLEPLYINTPITGTPIFLSKRLDPESLPMQTEPWLGHKYARFPKEAVLDLVIGVYDGTKGVLERSPLCSQAIDPHFETLPGPALWSASDGPAWTAQRRVLFTVDGRKILQDTNTSMADFVRAWKTPGWIPDTIPEGR